MAHIRLNQVRREFAGDNHAVALRDVTLTIDRGDFVVITGPSGSGKSTLLNVIGLLDKPSSGAIYVDGVEMSAATDATLTRLRAGVFAFVFQSFHLLERRPVVDSVELGLMYQGVPARARRNISAHALRRVGLLDKAWRDVNRLSGGERQRVAIARAVASAAEFIIADEPTGNLDSRNADRIIGLLQELNAAGSTIVLVTHSPEVAAIGARQISIRDGQVVSDVRLRPIPSNPLPAERADTDQKNFKLRSRDLIRDAVSSVRARGLRTAGLIAAVAVAVALAIATFGITGSAAAQVTDTFNAHTSRDVTAQWPVGALQTLPKEEGATLLQRVEHLNGVQHAALLDDLGPHSIHVSEAREPRSVGAFAATPDLEQASRMKITWAPGHGGNLKAGEILIGKTLAEQLKLASIDFGPYASIDGEQQAVAGIVTDSPRLPELMGAILKLKTDASPPPGTVQQYATVLAKPGAAQQVARQIPLTVNPYAPDKIIVDYPKDPTTLRAELQADVRNTLIAFTGVALLAAIAGLANSMMLSIVERQHEMGLRRAIGARKRHVTSLILVESSLLGAAGGIIGFALGIAGVLAVTLARHWVPTFDLRLAPAALVGGIMVGILGGVLAAGRASRIAPSQALHL